jgi:putative tricarboxylic transport membrane protein
MRTYDLISSLFLTICGILITIRSLRLHVGTFENPGLGLFPLLTGILLGLLSGVLFVACLLQRSTEREGSRSEPGRLWRKVIPAVLLMLGYALTIDRLGFLSVTFLFLLFLFKAIGNEDMRFSLGGALLVSLVSYLLFKVFLNVQLPTGPLGL